MSLTTEKIWESLELYGKQYVKFGSESVRFNSHIHRLGPTAQPPPEIVAKCVMTFVRFCQQDLEFWKGQTSARQILDTLVGFARSFPKKQEGTKAIIVDFINYVGTMNGINYALQTSDIYDQLPQQQTSIPRRPDARPFG